MGDSVGICGPHAKRAVELTKSQLRKAGVDPDTIDPSWIENFGASMSTLSHKQLTEQEFCELLESDARAKAGWATLTNRQAA